jgi:hypothetical protein
MRTRILASSLFAVLLSACQGKVDTTGQSSEGFPAPDRSMVMDYAWEAVRQQGFTPDSSASAMSEGVIVTRHKLDLSPFSGHGYREKATVRVKEVPQRNGYFTVEVNVLREYNDNIAQPSNPIAAEWRSAVRAPDVENLIKSRVEMAFIQPGASTQFRETHGLPSEGSGRMPELSTQPAPKDTGWYPGK